MNIIIAEPVVNENTIESKYIVINYIKDEENIELKYFDSGIKYTLKIFEKDIPIVGFNLETFNNILTDVVNKKGNSELNIKLKDTKCFVHFCMILDDYLKTEYRFVLVLNPVDEKELLKIENSQLKKNINILTEQVEQNMEDIVELKETVKKLSKKIDKNIIMNYMVGPNDRLLMYKLNSEYNKYKHIDLEGLALNEQELKGQVSSIIYKLYNIMTSECFELYEITMNIPFEFLYKHILDFVLKDHINAKKYLSRGHPDYYFRYLEFIKENPINYLNFSTE